MNKGIEVYCRSCGHTHLSDHNEYECPECGGSDIHNCRYVMCDCGEMVYTSGSYNECECGKLYNAFGQALAPVEQWEEQY